MGEKKNKSTEKMTDEKFEANYKRCPECFVNLPLDAKKCFSCHTRVGGVDKHGKARRGIDWISYVMCILSWAFLISYIKWAFF